MIGFTYDWFISKVELYYKRKSFLLRILARQLSHVSVQIFLMPSQQIVSSTVFIVHIGWHLIMHKSCTLSLHSSATFKPKICQQAVAYLRGSRKFPLQPEKIQHDHSKKIGNTVWLLYVEALVVCGGHSKMKWNGFLYEILNSKTSL